MFFLKVYWRAMRLLWSERLVTTALGLSGLAMAVIQLLEPLLFGRVIYFLTRGEPITHILTLWAGLGVLNVLFSVFVAVMADRLAHRQRLRMLSTIFEHAITLPFSFHAETGSGRVVRAILSGTDQLFGLWLTFMREYLPAIVTTLVLVPTALSLDWRMAALLLVLAVVYAIANWVIMQRTYGPQADVEHFYQDVFGRVGDVIGNVSVVQAYSRLSHESQALQEIISRLLRLQYPVLTWWGLLNVLTRVSATLTMVSLLALGSYLVQQGELTVGDVVAFTGFSTLLIGRLDQVTGFFSRLVSQAPTLATFFDLLDYKGGAIDAPQARPLTEVSGEVRFDNVTYKYPGKTQGVSGLTFTAKAGQTIALVGPSGSGKSTAMGLLQRLIDPQEGSISIDGQDIRNFTLASLRQVIATVFQDSGLFNRSIAENIRVGRPDATDAEVEEAARRADAHEFIVAKRDGYQFVIGERGSLLSGGERQRLAIARAVLKNSNVLIFDEATSALDTETELRIQNAIKNLRAGKTTFMIAHRLSTVVAADLILVFENGRIVESGTFQELKTKRGLFARLVSAGELRVDNAKTPNEVPR